MIESDVRSLDDLLRYGKTSSYSIDTLSLCELSDNVVYFDKFAYQKYEKILLGLSTNIELTDDQLRKYKYNPYALSYDLYGTTNLYHLILFLNNCSEFEFRHKRIKLLAAKYVKSVLQPILDHEQNHLKENINMITG